MSNSVLRDKSKDFAKNIIFLCRKLKQNGVESALINQLLRCGTSVGANIHEAQYAQGTKDFISKLEIALKECNESEYWLELLYETNSLTESDFCEHFHIIVSALFNSLCFDKFALIFEIFYPFLTFFTNFINGF